MFEHVALRKANDGNPISAGNIAEALLYYQKVHLIIDRNTLFGLIRQLGANGVLLLASRHDLSAVYCEEMLGAQTQTFGATEFHSVVAFRLAGTSDRELKTPHERMQAELEVKGIMTKSDAKRFTEQFFKRVPLRRFSGNHFVKDGIHELAARDFLDVDYLKQALRTAIAVTPGGYDAGDGIQVEIFKTETNAVSIFTNIDFDGINKRRENIYPSVSALKLASLLENIIQARADIVLSSFYGGDFVTSSLTSQLIQVKCAELLRRTHLNTSSQQNFSTVVLPDTPSLAEVIDSGERSFDDFLKLLDKASRFKDWLKATNPDEDLLQTYMRDISSKGWIEKLPSKSIRYVLTLGLDAANPVLGIVAGFIDNFVIEKLLSGWRPNHFVTTNLAPFVRGY